MFSVMNAKYWLLVLALVILGVFPGKGMAATILLEDNFNTENGGSGALNYNSFANWDVTGGTVDLIGNGYYDYRPGNGLYVDLDGSSWNAGRLESKTTFALSPGTYELRYDISGSHVGGAMMDFVTVGLGSSFNFYFGLPSGVPFIPFVHSFSVPSLENGKLFFDHDGGDNIGLLLDNVKLTYVEGGGQGVTTTPEPTTFALLGIGLVGLAGATARRKFKKEKRQ